MKKTNLCRSRAFSPKKSTKKIPEIDSEDNDEDEAIPEETENTYDTSETDARYASIR